MSRKGVKNFSEMSFFDHLDELRGTLFRALAGLVLAMMVAYYFAPQLQEFILIPFKDLTNTKLALLAPTEGFVVRLKIALVAGIFGSAPWIFYQLWRFVAPGLFESERKMVIPVVFFSSFLFLLGAYFGTYILPMATRFFLGFTTDTVGNYWSLGRYIDFVLRLLLAFGVVFELPLLIYFLARFGVVTPPFLRTYRRHMYVVILVAAAIITPPDVFTQVVLAVPMVLLYEASIALSVVAHRRWKKSLAFNDEDAESKEKEGAGAEAEAPDGGTAEEAASPAGDVAEPAAVNPGTEEKRDPGPDAPAGEDETDVKEE